MARSFSSRNHSINLIGRAWTAVTRTTMGVPRLPGGYNNNLQIVQTPEHVTILIKMVHEVRIIPLDPRPHVAPHIRQWLGDSRGRWEGDTLVVETTNFTHKTNFRGSAENFHLVKCFTRVDADTLRTSSRSMIRRPEAVDEARGCGWVDGKRKRIDAISYTIRFSPRTPRSTWKEETKARRLRQLIDDSAEGRAIPPLAGKTKA